MNEIKQEILQDYTGEFKRVVKLSVVDQLREKHIRFRNTTDCESYINAIGQDYKSEDVVFNGYLYKIDTPQLNLVNRSQYGNSCDFKHEVNEYQGNNCFIPTKNIVFLNVIFI